jgi:hypothetical protein
MSECLRCANNWITLKTCICSCGMRHYLCCDCINKLEYKPNDGLNKFIEYKCQHPSHKKEEQKTNAQGKYN